MFSETAEVVSRYPQIPSQHAQQDNKRNGTVSCVDAICAHL